MVRMVRTGAARAALVTTSMWQRDGGSHVAATSTWLGAGPPRAGPGPVRPVRWMRYPGAGHRPAARASLRKSRTQVASTSLAEVLDTARASRVGAG